MPTANTDSGDRILFMQFKNYNHDMFEYIPLYKYLVMWMEYTLLTYGTFNGLIVVVDSKGLSWRHILKIPLAVSGKMLKYLQVCFKKYSAVIVKHSIIKNIRNTINRHVMFR